MPSDTPTPIEQQERHTLATIGTAARPGDSFRSISEPCPKHAKNPPGVQSWHDDARYAKDAAGNTAKDDNGDAIEIAPRTPKRDPNGFDHDCPACVANFAIVKE